MQLPMPHVIGLYSDAPRSGKSTIANILQNEYGFTRLSFASPLKDMVAVFLDSFGIPMAELPAYLNGDKKEEVIRGLGVSSRYLQQTLGTEWGRELISNGVWIELARRRCNRILEAGGRVVFDDVRFPNEALLIREYFGWLTKVENPRVGYEGTHASEGALADCTPYFTWQNDGSLEELENKVRGRMNQCKVLTRA